MQCHSGFMARNDDYSDVSISRRKLLGSVGVGTVFSTNIQVVGAIQGNPTVEIPIAEANDEVVATMEVPQNWWQREQQYRRVQSNLETRYRSREEVRDVFRSYRGENISGKAIPSVTIGVKSQREKRHIPNKSEGVDIETVVSQDQIPACYNNDFYSVTYGGYLVSDSPDEERAGTLCCRVDYNGSNKMITAHHIWGDCDDQDISGMSAYREDHWWGNVESHYPERDIAVVDNDGAASTVLQDEIETAETQNDSTDIVGIDGVVTNASALTGETVHKTGITTGYTTGTLTSVDRDPTYGDCRNWNSRGYGIQDSNSQLLAQGDSGGPSWVEYQGDLYILGMNLAVDGADGIVTGCENYDKFVSDKAIGLTAEAIEDFTGFTFPYPDL